jgi:uncharacterized protein YjhX (UPF0386 family)
MDISRAEQRILHLLAQGGRIELERDETRTILNVHCITRDGWRAGGMDLPHHSSRAGAGALAARQSLTTACAAPVAHACRRGVVRKAQKPPGP